MKMLASDEVAHEQNKSEMAHLRVKLFKSKTAHEHNCSRANKADFYIPFLLTEILKASFFDTSNPWTSLPSFKQLLYRTDDGDDDDGWWAW